MISVSKFVSPSKILTLFILVCAFRSISAQPVLELPSGVRATPFYFFEDKSGSYKIEDAPNLEYAPLPGNFRFNFSESIFFFRFDVDVENPNQGIIIGTRNAWSQQTDFLIQEPESSQICRSGLVVPIEARTVRHLFPTCSVHNPGKMTVYLRTRNHTNADTLRAFVKREADFWATQVSLRTFDGMFVGVFIVMALYNLGVFLTLRDKSYLLYVLYIVFFGMFQIANTGFGYRYLWPHSLNFQIHSSYIFPSIATFFSLWFCRSFLLLKENTPVLDKFVLGGMIACLLCIDLIPFGFRTAFYLSSGSSMVAIVLAITSGIVRLRQGFTAARYFLLAWSILLASVIVFVLGIVLLIPFSPDHWLQFDTPLKVGPALEFVILSFALSDRIVKLREEKEAEQARRLQEQASALAYQQEVNTAIARFVPSEFLRLLGKSDILSVKRGDARRVFLTILFSDIRGFTTLSEKLSPEENFSFLNNYLELAGPVIRNHNGFVDKYIGDAIMALFPGSVDDAIAAARELRKCVITFREKTGHDLDIGVGIHCGEVVIGTIGELERLNGTVISDAVNLASRIESLTKEYGKPVLVSGDVQKASGHGAAFQKVAEVSVKGRTAPTAIYSID